MNTPINAKSAPAAVGPYSHAVRTGDLLFTSGQLGIDPATGKLLEGVEAQTRQALANLRAVLEAGGATPRDVVKCTVFVSDMNDFTKINALYASVFTENPPARSLVQVARLPLGAEVEIEAVAALAK
ncbi:MAG TPA: RidA family protein [Polyangia bacterium]|nr:RidA family protein [Polyangia bacterium]